jgi:Tol biopolymer transport system component
MVCIGSFVAGCDVVDHDMPIGHTYTKLYIVRSDGTDLRLLAESGIGATPFDSLILFATGNYTLSTIRLDGTELQSFFPSIPWGQQAFSFDESRILLASNIHDAGGYGQELYLLDPVLFSLTKLSLPKAIYLWPRLSPQSDRVVFYRDGGIAMIRVNGSGLTSIVQSTDSSGGRFGLFASESTIVYFCDIKAQSQIRLYNTSTHADRQIGSLSAGFPGYGRVLVQTKLLFTDLDTIKILDLNTLQLIRPGRAFGATFSSDGSQIVAHRLGTVFIVNSDGSNLRTVYSEPDERASIMQVHFTPGDSHVLFSTSMTLYSR